MRNRGERGITLLELLVALAILGLVMSLGVTYFRPGSGGIELRRTARELVSGLRQARSRAIAENRSVAITIDPGARFYAVDGRARALEGSSAALAVRQRAVAQGSGEAAGARIAFRPDGSAAGGTVSLSGTAGRQEIDIDPITGRVLLRR